MSARKHSSLLLKKLSEGLLELTPTLVELQGVLDANQNDGDGDGSFTEESFNATVRVARGLRALFGDVRGAIDATEATEVGYLKRRS